MSSPLNSFTLDKALIQIFPDARTLGRAGAAEGVRILRASIEQQGSARLIVATGNSQDELIGALVEDKTLDWIAMEVFHMDEYLSIPADHPASFRNWLRRRLVEKVKPGRVHYLNGEAPDVQRECDRYAELLARKPVDLCFLGFGENGHIAFNDPNEADFNDERLVKPVRLDERCRRQQVGEGHFPALENVPTQALSLTCPALMSADHIICSVPDTRKAEAVQAALLGPVSTACPASLVRTHRRCLILLDVHSAARLPKPPGDTHSDEREATGRTASVPRARRS